MVLVNLYDSQVGIAERGMLLSSTPRDIVHVPASTRPLRFCPPEVITVTLTAIAHILFGY